MRRSKRKVVRTPQYRGFGDFPAAGKDLDVRISCAAALVVFFAAMTLSGCQSEAPYFRPNLVEIEIEQDAGEPVTEDQQRTINETMLAMFGTPDHPANPFPQDDELVDAISPLKTFGFDIEKLKIAAGPAYRDQQGNQHGLYRLHCAHCHGVSGGGDGPTAPFLNPYPRDYRQGVFKYKSTFGAAKPTHDDLKRLLIHGVAGTSMPSFRTLPDNEIEALVEYVRYLSVRGETEIRVIEYLAAEGEMPGSIAEIAGGFPFALDDEGLPEEEPDEENVVASVVYQWDSAPLQEIHPVSSPIDYSKPGSEAMQASIARGEKLFIQKTCSATVVTGTLLREMASATSTPSGSNGEKILAPITMIRRRSNVWCINSWKSEHCSLGRSIREIYGSVSIVVVAVPLMFIGASTLESTVARCRRRGQLVESGVMKFPMMRREEVSAESKFGML